MAAFLEQFPYARHYCGGTRCHPHDQDVVSALREVLAHSESGRDLCKYRAKKVPSLWGTQHERGDL